MSLVNNTQVAKGILMSLINNVLGTLHAPTTFLPTV